MTITDPQLKSNDCGISAIKTIYNIFDIKIDRKYIVKNVPLSQGGAEFLDVKNFFESNGVKADYRLLDVNNLSSDIESIDPLFPFIIPVRNTSGLHYLVISGRKKKRLKIHDPHKGSEYFMSLEELKSKAFFLSSFWDAAPTQDKIKALCSNDLNKYGIGIDDLPVDCDYTDLFNKLTYISYVQENYGFGSVTSEKEFAHDLVFNQQLAQIPKSFKNLKISKDRVKLKAPLILVVEKPKSEQVSIPPSEAGKENMYWTLFKQLGKYRKAWYIFIFASLFSAGITQLSVFVNQILIDNVLPSYNLGTLKLFIIGLILYKLFDLSSSFYKSYIGLHLKNSLDGFFISAFDEKINRASLPYIASYKKGDLLERISDALRLKTFFTKFVISILVDLSISIYSLLVLFALDWKLSMVVVVVMGLFLVWYKIITPYLKQNERIRYFRKAEFMSRLIEKVEGIQVIKSFGIENHFSRKIATTVDGYLQIQLRSGYLSLFNGLVITLVILCASLVIIYSLAKGAITSPDITLGQLITFIALSGKIFSSLKGILSQNLSLQENEVILRRYMDFDEDDTISSRYGEIQLSDVQSLKFNDVSFGYETNKHTLHNVSFFIEHGQKIKIEGKNGSGKSTMAKILTSLYHVQSGEIEINGMSSNLIDKQSITNRILLVSNEDILFNDTIRGNICLGREVSDRHIIKLAKSMNFYKFISQKNEGLDYVINENGKNLSTGQRKKVLMLRALVSDADLIILDEVLSGMDKASREVIETFLDTLSQRTLIVISHEPVEHMTFDKNYRIEKGSIYEL